MVGVVILNYATYGDTIRLVAELQGQSIASQLRIVVVDNHSPNESYERLKPLEVQMGNVEVLQTQENGGYAKGNNFGLDYLERSVTPPKYVAIVNNDVSLPRDCFERLVARYEELDSAAVISPVMVDEKGCRHMPYRVNRFRDDMVNLSLVLRTILPCRSKQQEVDNTGQGAMRCEMISGSFMFLKFATFKKIGYFYPNTFLYAEERFIAHRVKQLGLSNYLILDQSYLHAHNSPTISSFYSQVGKYRMVYDSWLEYSRVCRKRGRLKAGILKPFMWLSLLEWRVIGWFKLIISRCQGRG